MAGFFNYDTKLPDAPQAVQGFRVCSGIIVGLLFAVCTVLLITYKLNKRITSRWPTSWPSAEENSKRQRRPSTS